MAVELNDNGEIVLPRRGSMELVRLNRTTAGHAALFEQVMSRVSRFSFEHGCDPASLVQELWGAFSTMNPLYCIWAGVERGNVVGHLLLAVQNKDGYPVAYILQADSDVILPRRMIKEALGALHLWVQEFNLWADKAAPHLHLRWLYMESHRMSEAWMRHVGFEPHRMIFRRAVL